MGSPTSEVLYQRNRLILQSLMDHNPDFTAGPATIQVLHQTYSAKNRRGLRWIDKDVKELFALFLSRFQQVALQERLAELQLLG
ncbi:hypothetical protein [Hymenobacter sp. IS2118]|uniref:hypothetical protein n=1 Tax=Hymenobacter sp. IS2118 TaxID=1505605 RepID=UPI001267E291|nr:hypothetical protein [Hymenobacter sp. IS2118]